MLLGIAATGRARLRADEPPRASAAAAGRRRPIRCASRLEAQLGDHRPRRRHRRSRPRTSRSGVIRKPRPSSRANSIASRMQAKRMGCESSGFFSLFNGQSAQCGPVNNQIQQMRANLDQITTSLERLRSGGIGGADRENQRRSVLTALAQNNCGPQYANAAPRAGPAISWTICSATTTIPTAPPSADLGPPSGTYRTVCVRTCDGAYFPVSFATVQARFPDDEKTCKALCPATEADLVRLPQSRRRHQPGGLDQRPALFGAAQRVQIPHRVQPVLRLQGRGPDLVRGAEIGRRQGRGRTARRHHRHRGKREADAAARAAEGPDAAAHGQEGRSVPPVPPPPRRRPRHRPPPIQRSADEKKSIRTVGPTFIPPKQ